MNWQLWAGASILGALVVLYIFILISAAGWAAVIALAVIAFLALGVWLVISGLNRRWAKQQSDRFTK